MTDQQKNGRTVESGYGIVCALFKRGMRAVGILMKEKGEGVVACGRGSREVKERGRLWRLKEQEVAVDREKWWYGCGHGRNKKAETESEMKMRKHMCDG